MTETPAVREWFLRFERAFVARRGVLHDYLAVFKAPLRAAREAGYGASHYGARMKAADRAGALTLRWRLYQLNFTRRVDSEAFYTFALHRHDRWRRRSLYVSRVEGTLASRLAVHLLYEKQFRLLGDKRSFDEWAERSMLPVVRALGRAANGDVVWTVPVSGPVPECDMFIKKAVGYGGYDTMQARWLGGTFECSDGITRGANELGAYLEKRSRSEALLVQPLLVNHPDISRLSVRALNTIRVTTCRDMKGNTSAISAAIRLATGNATADNVSQGGLGARVDPVTGKLGKAVKVDEFFDEYHFSHHPDTREAIVGTEVPFWKEARELAERAHALLGGIPCAAWDIAVLEDGPVIVEGNWNGDTWIPQVPGDTPLFTTNYDKSYAEPLAALVDRLTDEELLQLGQMDPRAGIA